MMSEQEAQTTTTAVDENPTLEQKADVTNEAESVAAPANVIEEEKKETEVASEAAETVQTEALSVDEASETVTEEVKETENMGETSETIAG